jgi:hypothetical protein
MNSLRTIRSLRLGDIPACGWAEPDTGRRNFQHRVSLVFLGPSASRASPTAVAAVVPAADMASVLRVARHSKNAPSSRAMMLKARCLASGSASTGGL